MDRDAFDSDAFDVVVASVDPALVVVTTAVATERAGCLVGFHAQSSIDPRRYTVWLSKANHTYRLALRSTHLGIHFLAGQNLSLAERFGTLSGDTTDKFAGLDVGSGPGDVPVLLECPHRFVVRRVALLDEGGDHVCVVTELIEAHGGSRLDPLRLSDASGLQPGHRSNERHDPPTQRAM